MKNKNKILIISIIVTCIVIVVLSMLLIKYNDDSNDNQNNNNNNNSETNNGTTINDDTNVNKTDDVKIEKPIVIEDEKILESKKLLLEYSEEIYNERKHLNLKQDKSGYYYATKKDLQNLGYDVTKIDSSCKDEDRIILFNVDGEGNISNEKKSYVIRVKCAHTIVK